MARTNLNHPGQVFHLKPLDPEGTRFSAELVADGFQYFARYALDLTPDGQRLSIVDDVAGLVYVLERK